MIKTGKWLKETRELNKLTQEQLAKELDVHPRTIINIEQGARIGSPETWDKINNFFDGAKVSYDSEEMIEELNEDISLFGGDSVCYAFYEIRNDMLFFTDYILESDFLEEDKQDKHIKITLKEALEIFTYQNKIV